MPTLGLEDHIVDRGVYDRTVRRFSEAQVLLPTFAELAEPEHGSLMPSAALLAR